MEKRLAVESSTPIHRENDGSLRKIFRSAVCDPSIYETFRKQGKYCDITLVSAVCTARYVFKFIDAPEQ